MRGTSNTICLVVQQEARLLVGQEEECLAEQEDMSSCWTGRNVVLLDKKTCLLVGQEDTHAFWTRRRVFLSDHNLYILVEEVDVSSCWARRNALLLNKTTCLLVEQEYMSSCSTGRHVFLFNQKTFLLSLQEDMSPCSKRRRHVLLNKNTCRHVFWWSKQTCILVQSTPNEHPGARRRHPGGLRQLGDKINVFIGVRPAHQCECKS